MDNIISKCQGYMFMYQLESTKYKRIHNIVQFIFESIGPTIGGILLDDKFVGSYPYILSLILIITPVIKQIFIYMKFDEWSNQLRELSVEFDRILVLAENNDDRVLHMYTELLTRELPISKKTINKYLEYFSSELTDTEIGTNINDKIPEIARKYAPERMTSNINPGIKSGLKKIKMTF